MTDDFAATQIAIPGLHGGGSLDLADDGPVRPLTRRQKAAVIVRLLISRGVDLPLEELPDKLQISLTKEMGEIGLIDRATLHAVTSEFADELAGVGLAFPHGLVEALNVMDGKLSAQTASRLRKEAGVRVAGDPWRRLREIPVSDLVDLVLNESVEVAAVLLSKLEVQDAAELLGLLPGPLARQITFSVNQTRNISAEAVERIGVSLITQLNMRPAPVFHEGPEQRMGAILTLTPSDKRRDMLESLDEQDKDFAGRVRAALFTYEDIPDRIPKKDIARIVSMIDQKLLIKALAGSTRIETERTLKYIYGNITQRMAGTLMDEVKQLGDIDQKEADMAMAEVMLAIQAFEETGEIKILPPKQAAAHD